MAASNAIPVVRAAGEGEKLWFYGGGVHIWKATSEETGGAFLLFEGLFSQGKTTPLHTHPDVDETLYVLEGEILVHIDGGEHSVGPRGVAVAPRGVPHAFLVTSPTARVLTLQTPAAPKPFTAAPANRGAPTATPRAQLTSPACARRRNAPEV